MKKLTLLSFASKYQRLLCFSISVLFLPQTLSAQGSTNKPARELGKVDIIRIRELHHVTNTFGDQIWPGFDTRKIPVAINNDDKEELLIGHPNPPEEYHPFREFKVNGQPAMIRDGVNRYGPRGGGWAVKLGGKQSAYVSTLKQGRDTEGYLSLILHECFHCFQKDYRQRAEGAHGELPEDDPVYSALIGLEGRILKAALEEPNDEKIRKLAKMFVAGRHERRRDMAPNLIILEGENEYSEGTATYSQARMLQLIMEKGDFAPAYEGKDPQYHGFPDAKREYERMISSVTPPRGHPITFFHAMYKHGMAQCLLLDRVRPKWKEQMRPKGMTQFALLEREFPLLDDEEKELLAEAKKQFDYDDLLTEQTKLVNERLDLIRGYLYAPGRRYRFYHHRIRKGFKWKPSGPVYHIPKSLEKEFLKKRKQQGHETDTLQHQRTIWVGGLHPFKKNGFVFESVKTPILFGHDYFEWSDPDPAPDQSDMMIESESREAETYIGAKIKTDGFTLEADRAIIEWSEDTVKIYLLPK